MKKFKKINKTNLKKIAVSLSFLGMTAAIAGCASSPAQQTFAPATEVVTKTITVPMQAPTTVDASFGYGTNPALVAAYQSYEKTGKAPHVTTDGFVGFPYDPTEQIYIACQPLHICTILFEQGELIRDISLGDTANWDVKPMFVGGQWPNGAELLVIKPKTDNLSTNLVLTSQKRIYNIALLTSDKDYLRQAVFYYPTDTDAAISNAANAAISQESQQSQNVVADLQNGTNINLNNVNFNYSISGDDPTWTPMRAFDDGVHTIIQFPSSVNSGALPVLFVLNNGQDQLVNFRKKVESDGTVDYVVDQVFAEAVLVSGVGGNQTKVVVTNNKLNKSWF